MFMLWKVILGATMTQELLSSLDKFINPRQFATVSRAQRLARYPAATCVWVTVYESVNEQQIVKLFRWKLHTNAAISHLFCNEHVLLLF